VPVFFGSNAERCPMPCYLPEQDFPDDLNIPVNNDGAKVCLMVGISICSMA